MRTHASILWSLALICICGTLVAGCGTEGSDGGQNHLATTGTRGRSIDYQDPGGGGGGGGGGCWPSWSFVAYGNVVCHLDKDLHLFDTDIEFYVADQYTDTVCGVSEGYHERRVATVSCSNFTSLFDNSSCANKVRDMFVSLAASGIYPGVQDVDQDLCPTPRF
jgi:hypothetical protein